MKDQGEEEGLAEAAGGYLARKAKGLRYRKGYVEGEMLTAQALAMEEEGEYRKAKGLWKKVLEADPGSETARIRLRLLESLL